MNNQQQNKNLQDEARIAHMIAWRDKRISMLQDMLDALDEAGKIYAAYITFLLERCYGRVGYIRVSKADIRSVCGKYRVSAEDAGDEFIIRLVEAGEEHEANPG